MKTFYFWWNRQSFCRLTALNHASVFSRENFSGFFKNVKKKKNVWILFLWIIHTTPSFHSCVFTRISLGFCKIEKKRKNVVVYIINFYFRCCRVTKKGTCKITWCRLKKLEEKVFSTETKLKNCCIELIFILEKFKVMYKSGFFVFMFIVDPKSLELLVITWR